MDIVIDWSRDWANEARLTFSITRHGRTRTYKNVSAASLYRVHRWLDTPGVEWKGGSLYWGGLIQAKEK